MRKFVVIGMLLVVALAGMVGTIFAQEATDTPEESASGAWLGVALIEENEQVIVTRVIAGSPANVADMMIGDVITAFNGEAITSASQLAELVQAAAPGDTVTVEVLRNSATVSVEVTLISAPPARWGNEFGGRGDNGRREGRNNDPFGFDGDGFHFNFNMPVDALSTAELLLNADLEETDAGFEVAEVASANPFDLQAGDVITAVNEVAIADLDFETLMNSIVENEAVTLTVTRDGESITLESDFFRFMPGRGGRWFDDENDDTTEEGQDANFLPSLTPSGQL